MIRVISVPHSGTRFTMKILDQAGVEYMQLHFSKNKAVHNIYDDMGPVIVPLRSREEVMASWERRKKLNASHDFQGTWAEMEGYCKTREVYPLRIDDPEHRDADLAAISELVGKPLEVDWSEKVGQGQ